VNMILYDIMCVLNVGRGQRELVGVKTGYDIMCVLNVGRGQRELVGVKTGYDIMCVKCRKGPVGAGRCEDGV